MTTITEMLGIWILGMTRLQLASELKLETTLVSIRAPCHPLTSRFAYPWNFPCPVDRIRGIQTAVGPLPRSAMFQASKPPHQGAMFCRANGKLPRLSVSPATLATAKKVPEESSRS